MMKLEGQSQDCPFCVLSGRIVKARMGRKDGNQMSESYTENEEVFADIVINGRIFGSDSRARNSALAVKDGKYLAIGDCDEISRYIGLDTIMCGYKNKSVLACLVIVAPALRAAEGERLFIFVAKKRKRKIAVLLHEFICVSLRAHENRDNILAPQLAYHAPADGHGIITTRFAGGQQCPIVPDKAREAVFYIADINFFKAHGKYPFSRLILLCN